MVLGNVQKPIIQTSRLELRDFREVDLVEVHEYASDPQVARFMNWGPNTEEEPRGFIQKSIAYQKEKPRVNYPLAVVVREGNKLIGGCGVYESNIKSRVGWIGYCLNRQFWGHGYATETAIALLGFGFTHLNLHRIFATCDPANTASMHVMEKVGMQYEGHLRENIHCKGAWYDSLIYAILDCEWKTAK
ncbi:MAG: GNAT family N-acetyltransferase [Candidatus Bathyarchaeota archaeon]|nr:GNAT family N-acetyltransferase [Candidatus Bathyarchaeota archaeon]